MANSVEDLETIQKACKKMIRELAPLLVLAEQFDDPKVVARLHSAQSKLIFAKFAVNQLLRDQWVEVKYDEGECSDNEFCHDCPC